MNILKILSTPGAGDWFFSIRQRRINPPLADKGLIPRPLGRLRWFPIDTPLLAAGKFMFQLARWS